MINKGSAVLVFYKQMLADLSLSEMRFYDIYTIMSKQFCDEIFGIEFENGYEKHTTYKELFALCENIAGNLNKLFSEKKGACIAIRMDNSVNWTASFFGILMSGFKPVLINTRLDEESISDAIKRTDCIAVITDKHNTCENYINVNSLISKATAEPCWENEMILMSSGTTGDAKLIVYEGKAICRQVMTTEKIIKEAPSILQNRKLEIKILALLPFYHIFGLSAVMLWFSFFGRTLVFPTSLDVDSVRFACKRGGVTHFFAIPAVWNMAARSLLSEAKKQGKEQKLLKAVDFSNKLQNISPKLGLFVSRKILFADIRKQLFGQSVSFCISGGGFVSDEALKLLNGIGYALHVGYGMTETGITSVETSERPKDRNRNTVGAPLTGVLYTIDENGILLVKGDLLHSAIITENGRIPRNEDSYFLTNDSCKLDKSGRWIILGRQDDIIIGENGENISPDIIQLRLTAPASCSLCVLGLEDKTNCKKPVAVLGFNKNSTDFERSVAVNSLYSQIENLPITLRPQKIYTTLDEIPQNLGKVKRNLLTELIKKGEVRLTPAKVTSVDDISRMYDDGFKDVLIKVKAAFAEVLDCKAESIEDNSHFIYDLGGSSMAYYNLFAGISKIFSVELKIDSQVPLFTPVEFAKAILSFTAGDYTCEKEEN